MEKLYLAVVDKVPRQKEWVCRLPIGPDPAEHGRMRVDPRGGKEAETRFRCAEIREARALVEACPLTGRTHQIRLHLAANGTPIIGDSLYHPAARGKSAPLGLRAVRLAYQDPFTRRRVSIQAPQADFLKQFGFAPPTVSKPDP